MEIVKNFYTRLNTLEANDNLTEENIMKVIDSSDFDTETIKILKERVYSHRECNLEENNFTVAYYGGLHPALECEGCYSVIIDEEILEMMLEEEEE